MQILDFSQIFNAAIFVDSDANDCAKHPSVQSKNLLKHFIINSVRQNFNVNKATYGEMIIACDYSSWRYSYFPQYKYLRKELKKKDTSGIKWDFVSEVTEEVITDLKEKFPFSVIKVHKAEGDDVIGVLTKYISTTVTGKEDIFGNPEVEPVLIISSDKDNFQLHKYKNVRQYSPIEKKQIKPPVSWKHSLIEKIVKGEGGATSDGIPNIKMDDDTFVTGTRQKPISQKYLDLFIEAADPINVCLTLEEKVHYLRNETLVSYNMIPQHIQDAIILCYNEQVSKKHSKMQLMNYFVQNKMSNLLSNIHDFY